MTTEGYLEAFAGFETWSSQQMVTELLHSQSRAITAIETVLPQLAEAVDETVKRLQNGGRLIYVGAGTSGRLGVLDGSELLPTFGFPTERTIRLIAGGEPALMYAMEGAEDSMENGITDIQNHTITANDVVLGIAASGKTPYTLSAMQYAVDKGAYAIGIANNPDVPLLSACQVGLYLPTGAEPLAGSTRLTAGTSQKILLNIFSTSVMAKLGHVYQGYMVDVKTTNQKLIKRARDMVVTLTGVSEDRAEQLLQQSDNNVKTAVLLARGVSLADAKNALDTACGNLHDALSTLGLGE